MIRTMVQSDDVTTIDAMVDHVGDVEGRGHVTSLETQVRPVTHISSMPSIHAQLYHILHAQLYHVRRVYWIDHEVAKWLELQQHGGTVVPTSEVGLAGTVAFDLIFFNEVTKSDNNLKKY